MFRSDIVPFVKFDIIKDAPTIKYLAIIINPFYTNWSLGREWGVSHTLYAHNNTLSIKESDWRREKEGIWEEEVRQKLIPFSRGALKYLLLEKNVQTNLTCLIKTNLFVFHVQKFIPTTISSQLFSRMDLFFCGFTLIKNRQTFSIVYKV